MGSHLAIGGKYLTMWNFEVSFQLSPSSKKLEGNGEGGEGGGGGREVGGGGGGGRWKEVWRCKMALPIVHLKFSPDGAMFASVSEVCLRLLASIIFKLQNHSSILHICTVGSHSSKHTGTKGCSDN